MLGAVASARGATLVASASDEKAALTICSAQCVSETLFLPEVREFIKDTRPKTNLFAKTNTTRGGGRAKAHLAYCTV